MTYLFCPDDRPDISWQRAVHRLALGGFVAFALALAACGGGGGAGGDALAGLDTEPSGSGSSGSGFHVENGRLYDANGVEFRIRGVNRVHWDSDGATIPASNANTQRIAVDFTRPAAANVALMRSIIGQGIVPMPGNWDGTCETDPATLRAIVDTWVAQADAWKALDRWMILNIANEWGPEDSPVWRDAYINAIARLRAAGYTGTISVTSGGCGQDPNNLLKYAQAVFNSDPLKNVIFDLHVYGNFAVNPTESWQEDLATQLAALGRMGLPVVIGEFGPGRNIGPSPTLITPEQVIRAAEANRLGWLAWAWDDWNLPAGRADDNGFSMTLQNGVYSQSSDLTVFGQDVVDNPIYGLKVLARKATVFP